MWIVMRNLGVPVAMFDACFRPVSEKCGCVPKACRGDLYADSRLPVLIDVHVLMCAGIPNWTWGWQFGTDVGRIGTTLISIWTLHWRLYEDGRTWANQAQCG
jgi:hypothetical protein